MRFQMNIKENENKIKKEKINEIYSSEF
jgi:hypothetical protein